LDFDDAQGFDPTCESYVEITLDDNNVYVMNTLQTDVANAIARGFDINKMQFG